MSKKIKEEKITVRKYCWDEGKENVYPGQLNKLNKSKSDLGRKRTLSMRTKNGNNSDVAAGTASITMRETKFQIYFDDEESTRSRPRMRKNIRTEEENKKCVTEKPAISTNAMKKEKSVLSLMLSPVLQRSYSFSHADKNRLTNRNNKLNKKPFCRSCSENRYLPRNLREGRCPDVKESNFESSKAKHLTNEVKQRTTLSIQAWKNKMRQSRLSGAVPKIPLTERHTASRVKKVHSKTKLQNICNTSSNYRTPPNINIRSHENPKIMSSDEVNREFMHDSVKRDKTPLPMNFMIDFARLNTLVKDKIALSSPHEFVEFLQNSNILIVQNDNAGMNNKDSDKLNGAKKSNSNDKSTRPKDAPAQPLGPNKVFYKESDKFYKTWVDKVDKESFNDIYKTLNHEHYYLEYLLHTEINRDKSAPKPSARFLNDNINSEQRRKMVQYLIHLGMHCNYGSAIVYQTVKLFDTANDKIHMYANHQDLMALACLWIILKRDAAHHKIPTATKLILFAKDNYTREQLLLCEKKILSTFEFNIWFADPFSLLMHYIWIIHQETNYINVNEAMHIFFCGSYLIDLSMFDEYLSYDIPICIMVQAALELSLDFSFTISSKEVQKWRQFWRSKTTSKQSEENVINFVKFTLMKLVLESEKSDSKIVYKKYQRSIHGKVSNFLLERAKESLRITILDL